MGTAFHLACVWRDCLRPLRPAAWACEAGLSLAGCRALITGGDSVIGRAVALAYAREGADVAISYLSEEESDARGVAALVRKVGRRIVLLPVLRLFQITGYVVAQLMELGGALL